MRRAAGKLPVFLPLVPLRHRVSHRPPPRSGPRSRRLAMTAARPRVLVLAGPTAVGKSSVALALAKGRLAPAEIVAADSVQVYRGLSVGSNAPTPEEMARVPHHLVGSVSPAAPHSAGAFLDAAEEAVREIAARGAVPLVVGGTMMYLRWLVHGRPATPAGSAAAARRVDGLLEGVGGDWGRAVEVLRGLDWRRAGAIGRNDWYRLRRALQVAVEEEGVGGIGARPVVGGAPGAGVVRGEAVADFRCFFLFDDRVGLNRRIDRRCEEMLIGGVDGDGEAQGEVRESVLEEVTGLLVSDVISTAHGSPARAIGYRQTIGYLLARAEAAAGGDGDPAVGGDAAALAAFREFLDEFRQATRGYAKQQMQWFRKERGYIWVRAGGPAAGEIARLFSLGEDEFEEEVAGERFAAAQRAMRDEVLAQGRAMKRYVSEEGLLVRGSEAEVAVVTCAERCARMVLEGMGGVMEVRRMREELRQDGLGGGGVVGGGGVAGEEVAPSASSEGLRAAEIRIY